MVSQEDSFWHRGKRQLRNGLLHGQIDCSFVCLSMCVNVTELCNLDVIWILVLKPWRRSVVNEFKIKLNLLSNAFFVLLLPPSQKRVFTLLFCRGRQRNVQRFITHVHSWRSHIFANVLFLNGKFWIFTRSIWTDEGQNTAAFSHRRTRQDKPESVLLSQLHFTLSGLAAEQNCRCRILGFFGD